MEVESQTISEATFLDRRAHSEALAVATSLHLQRGDAENALLFADRRCRLARAEAQDWLLRAEASRLAGFAEFAQIDLTKAVECDPTDILANRAALAWASGPEQRAAALRLLGAERPEAKDAQAALQYLVRHPGCPPALQKFSRIAGSVQGWIAWRAGGGARLLLASGDLRRDLALTPDPGHPFASPGWEVATVRVSNFEEAPIEGSVLVGNVLAKSFWLPGTPRTIVASPASAEKLTVVVPVYRDLVATKACINSVLMQRTPEPFRLIVVNDASPESGLAEYLETLSGTSNVIVLQNRVSRGFAGAVNRALELGGWSDLLILNSDAWLPPDALDRMRRVAAADPRIGTVTPFSNNGEVTSFPAPYRLHPFESFSTIERVDNVAASANGLSTVEILNGVGFCLYVSHACATTVGAFAETYGRGYFEDVDLCLRARRAGYRNVCATGIYVGHHGSRSFQAEKHALVLTNLRRIEQKFPGFRLEEAAFEALDPLRGARARVEYALVPEGAGPLYLTAAGMAHDIAMARAKSAGDSTALIAVADEGEVRFRRLDGGVPQSLTFQLREPGERDRLHDYLARLSLTRIDLHDPASLPSPLIEEVTSLPVETRLVCGDLRWVYPLTQPSEGPCHWRDGGCASCLKAPLERASNPEQRRRLQIALSKARTIVVTDELAEALASKIFRSHRMVRDRFEDLFALATPALPSTTRGVAVLAPFLSPLVDRMAIGLGRELSRRKDPTPVFVLGACLDDFAAMASGNVFVTGRADLAELPRLVAQCRVDRLVSPYRTNSFWIAERLARATKLPLAYFDWSFGNRATKSDELILDTRMCHKRATVEIADWMKAQPSADRIGDEPERP